MAKNETWSYGRMPEYLWISIILDYYGSQKGFEKISIINEQIRKVANELSLPQLSHILKLSSEKQRIIYSSIKSITCDEILSPLTLVFTSEKTPIFSECFYVNNDSIENRIDRLKNVIDKAFSQSSDLSNHTRYCVIGFIAYTGRLHVREEQSERFSKYQDLSTDTDEYKMISSEIRAMESSLIKMTDSTDENYLNFFWDSISMMTDCKLICFDFGKSKLLKGFNQKVYDLLEYLRELYVNVYPLDKKLEIFTGIITYSYKRLKEIDEHDLYNTIVGRSCIRSLIENYILCKYLISFEKDKPEIWDDFEYYGIGQIKKIVLAARKNNSREKESHVFYNYLDILLNEFRMEEFIDIDVRGYFDGPSIRSKAEKVDEKELYSLYYDYDSQYEHALWGAIRESSMLKCNNSFHQYHLVPDIEDSQKLKSIYYDCIFVMKKMVSFYATQIEIPDEIIKGIIEYQDD